MYRICPKDPAGVVPRATDICDAVTPNNAEDKYSTEYVEVLAPGALFGVLVYLHLVDSIGAVGMLIDVSGLLDKDRAFYAIAGLGIVSLL